MSHPKDCNNRCSLFLLLEDDHYINDGTFGIRIHFLESTAYKIECREKATHSVALYEGEKL